RAVPSRAPPRRALGYAPPPAATEAWAAGLSPHVAALGAVFAVSLCVAGPGPTARLLTDVLGYREVGEEDGRRQLENPRADRAAFVDLYCVPGAEPGRMGAGVVHHVAFRVP